MRILRTVWPSQSKVRNHFNLIGNIDVKVDDFPHEVNERNLKIFKYEKMKKLLQIKDDIIWNLITDKKKRYDQETLLNNEKHSSEIEEMNRYRIIFI